jgi:IclR family pca regulon transcriptional regulator
MLGPLHSKSAGKALLAGLNDKALEAYFKTAKMDSFTEHTITSKLKLKEEIEAGRKRGWFINNGETESDLFSMSASFRWNEILYIVTIAAPPSRFKAKVEDAASMLTNVCKLLERGGDPTQLNCVGNS